MYPTFPLFNYSRLSLQRMHFSLLLSPSFVMALQMALQNWTKATDTARNPIINKINKCQPQPLSDLPWSAHTDKMVKVARKRLFFLRRLKKFGMDSVILTNFYRCTIESILTGCITVWYGSWQAKDRKVLRSVVRNAEFIIGRNLRALQDTYHTRCLGKAGWI